MCTSSCFFQAGRVLLHSVLPAVLRFRTKYRDTQNKKWRMSNSQKITNRTDPSKQGKTQKRGGSFPFLQFLRFGNLVNYPDLSNQKVSNCRTENCQTFGGTYPSKRGRGRFVVRANFIITTGLQKFAHLTKPIQPN